MSHEPAGLGYASPELRPGSPARVDVTVLALASVQVSLALVLTLAWTADLARGHSELEIGAWHVQAAWWVFDHFPFPLEWAALSMVAAIGAILPPDRRRAWYLIYACGFIAALLLWWSALLILDAANTSARWNSVVTGPQEYRSIVIEAAFYWQVALMMLIANPVFVALALRTLRRPLSRPA